MDIAINKACNCNNLRIVNGPDLIAEVNGNFFWHEHRDQKKLMDFKNLTNQKYSQKLQYCQNSPIMTFD